MINRSKIFWNADRFLTDFGTSGEGAIDGRIGKGPSQVPFNPPPSDNIFSDKQSLLGTPQPAAAAKSWNPFTLALFQAYFDVDTADIITSKFAYLFVRIMTTAN